MDYVNLMKFPALRDGGLLDFGYLPMMRVFLNQLNALSRLALPILSLPLCSCVSLLDAFNGPNAELVGAKPLPTLPTNGDEQKLLDPAMGKGQNNAYAAKLLSYSGENCLNFMNRLSVSERGVNSFFDISATITAAAATAITPIVAVHALTAATAVATGSKTAIDADVFEKETTPLIIQAIDQTYWVDYQRRIATLSDPATSQPDPYLWFGDIQGLNRECSLDYAIAHLSALDTGKKPALYTGDDLLQGRIFTTPDGTTQYMITQAPQNGGTTLTAESKAADDIAFKNPKQYNITDFLNLINPGS